MASRISRADLNAYRVISEQLKEAQKMLCEKAGPARWGPLDESKMGKDDPDLNLKISKQLHLPCCLTISSNEDKDILKLQSAVLDLQERELKLLDKVFKRADGPGDDQERCLGHEVARTTRNLRETRRSVAVFNSCYSHLQDIDSIADMALHALNDLKGPENGKETFNAIRCWTQQLLAKLDHRWQGQEAFRCPCGVRGLLAHALTFMELICIESELDDSNCLEMKLIVENFKEDVIQRRDGIRQHIDVRLTTLIRGAELSLATNNENLLLHRRNLFAYALENDGWCTPARSSPPYGEMKSFFRELSVSSNLDTLPHYSTRNAASLPGHYLNTSLAATMHRSFSLHDVSQMAKKQDYGVACATAADVGPVLSTRNSYVWLDTQAMVFPSAKVAISKTQLATKYAEYGKNNGAFL